MTGAALRLEGVVKRYRVGVPGCAASVDVLRGASLVLATGEVVLLAGGAGAGKSTLLLCAAGLLRPDAGRVEGARAAAYVPYTGDWRRRVAQALDARARVLLLDLPCEALPVRERLAAAALARHASACGAAVLLASRTVAALLPLAPRVALLRGGRVIARAAEETAASPPAPAWAGAPPLDARRDRRRHVAERLQ